MISVTVHPIQEDYEEHNAMWTLVDPAMGEHDSATEFVLDVTVGEKRYKLIKSFCEFKCLDKELRRDRAFKDLPSLPMNIEFLNKILSRQHRITRSLTAWMKDLLSRVEASNHLLVQKFLKVTSYSSSMSTPSVIRTPTKHDILGGRRHPYDDEMQAISINTDEPDY